MFRHLEFAGEAVVEMRNELGNLKIARYVPVQRSRKKRQRKLSSKGMCLE